MRASTTARPRRVWRRPSGAPAISSPTIHGTVAPGFEPVRDAFAAAFTELGETGAAFTAIAGGETIVELWGGSGVAHHALVHVYSVTKPFTAFCVLVLVYWGQVDLDAPIAQYWPGFAAAGKAGLPSGRC